MKSLAAAAAIALSIIGRAAEAASSPDLALVDFNLVPMDAERVIPHQTVIVHHGTIAAVGAAGHVAIPPAALQVNGGGATYLAPGLADMHTHVSDEADLALYLANGVTTVLHMGGPSSVWSATSAATSPGATYRDHRCSSA